MFTIFNFLVQLFHILYDEIKFRVHLFRMNFTLNVQAREFDAKKSALQLILVV